jgi:hypothetical protein
MHSLGGGTAKIFGKTYDAGYEPIKDASSAVIGAYFVAIQSDVLLIAPASVLKERL